MKKILICLTSCVVFYFTFDSWESHSAPIIFPILNLLATLGMIVTGFMLGMDIMSKILPLVLLLFSLQTVSAQSGIDLSNRFNMNGVHVDTSGRAIEVRSTRPEAVRLKNPLVAEPKTFGLLFVIIVGIICFAIGFILGAMFVFKAFRDARNNLPPSFGRGVGNIN